MQCQNDVTRLAAHAMIVVTPPEVNESAATGSQSNRAAADCSPSGSAGQQEQQQQHKQQEHEQQTHEQQYDCHWQPDWQLNWQPNPGMCPLDSSLFTSREPLPGVCL